MYGLPPGAVGPDVRSPFTPPVNNQDQRCSSIIGCQQQSLGEIIDLTNTPFNLRYQSDRMQGYRASNNMQIALSGANLPGSLTSITLQVAVAGQVFQQNFPPGPNQTFNYTWDGTDAYGRQVTGEQEAVVTIGYNYHVVRVAPEDFERSFATSTGVVIAGGEGSGDIPLVKTWRGKLSPASELYSNLGGWTIDAQNNYDPAAKVLLTGDGDKYTPQNFTRFNISTIAGIDSYDPDFTGDGGPGKLAKLANTTGVGFGPDGSYYIAEADSNRIRRVAPDGVITTFAGTGTAGLSGDGGPAIQAKLNSPGKITVGSDGSVYFSDTGNQRVRKISPNGIITTIAGSNYQPGGPGDQASRVPLSKPAKLVQAGDGSLYFTGQYRIWRIFPSGIITPVAGTGEAGYSGDGGPALQAQLNEPIGLAMLADGTIFFTDNKVVRKIAPNGIISTYAGSTYQVGGPGDPANRVEIAGPTDIVQAADGTFFVAEKAGNRVWHISSSGIITPVAGTGVAGFSGDGGPALQAQLNSPSRLALKADGTLYILDSNNFRIRKVAPNGNITTIAGTGIPGFSGDGGDASQAQFDTPSGLALGLDGSIYIADTFNHRIRKIAPNNIITTFAGNGTGSWSGDNGPATTASLNYPRGVSVASSDGSLYIADTGNGRVRRVSAGGIITTVAGSGLLPQFCNSSGETGPALQIEICPRNVNVTAAGVIYISDFNMVQRVDLAGNLTLVAGSAGKDTFTGDGGPAIEATFGSVDSVLVASDNYIYIADGGNSRIRRVAPDGTITSFAGYSPNYSGDGGQANQAQLDRPTGLAAAPDGTLYIADLYARRVRRVATNGIITTILGDANFQDTDNIPANRSSVWDPISVALAPDGTLYIAESSGRRVRRILPTGIITTVVGINPSDPRSSCPISTQNTPAIDVNVCPVDISFAADGSYYITDASNIIRRVGTDGLLNTVAGVQYSFNGSSYSGDGGPATKAYFSQPGSALLAADGNLYIADSLNGHIRRVTSNGIINNFAGYSQYYSGDGGPATEAQLSSPNGLALASDGTIYIADSYNNRIRRVASNGTITTYGGGGQNYFNYGDNGPAIEAYLGNPGGISLASDGSLYVTDGGNYQVRRILPSGVITTVAGIGGNNGSYCYSTAETGLATQMPLCPIDVAVDNNSFYILNNDHRVQKVTPDGILTPNAGRGEAGFFGDNGPAILAKLNFPKAISLDSNSNLYIADNSHIRKVAVDGTISTIAGDDGVNGDGGPARQAYLPNPRNITTAPDGSLLIADGSTIRRITQDGLISTFIGNISVNDLEESKDGNIYVITGNQVKTISPTGVITTIVGILSSGFSGDGGPANQAQLSNPSAIAIGADGTLFIADVGNNRIRRVGPDGTINTFAGGGTSNIPSAGISATQVQLSQPRGLVLAHDGTLFISDTGNNRVVKVEASGIIKLVAGNGSTGYNGEDLPATQAGLNQPWGLALDTEGTLFIAELGNSRLRRVGTDGLIQTVAGNYAFGYFFDDGPAAQATLNAPEDVTLGSDGAIYIADTGNQRIRKIAPTSPGLSQGNLLFASPDGSELYVFNAEGRHLKTLDSFTGGLLYQFGYDSSNRLISITDGDNNITTIERDGNGQPLAIVSPYGQRTTFTLNANGYLQKVTNPANESYELTYTQDGLLTSFTNPRGKTSTFIYDSVGRLLKDQNPEGGYLALSRQNTSDAFQVSVGSALGRSSVYSFTNSTSGTQRFNTYPTGLQSQQTENTDGTQYFRSPDGSVISSTLGPDPRWGMEAPFARSSAISTSSGLSTNIAVSNTVSLSNPDDPLSLTGQMVTTTVNGRTSISNYSAATRTFTDLSPEVRQTIATIDAQGRLLLNQQPGLKASNYSYDTRGRLISATVGSGAEARNTTFTYNSKGYIDSITDPTQRVATFTYDNAGRVLSQTLPGNRTMVFSYDQNGNLLSLTPPGKTAHTFTYNDVDLTSSSTAPSVNGGGTNQTTYNYNLDKDLTRITTPDNKTIDMEYDNAGRVAKMTTPQGPINYEFNPDTGNIDTITDPDGLTLSYSYDSSLLRGEILAGPVAGTVSRTYDSNFRVSSLSVNGGNPVNYQYDKDNLLTQAGSLSLTHNSQNGLLTGTSIGNISDSYGYNGFAELSSYSASNGGTNQYSAQYTRDKLGRISQKVEISGSTTTTYDYRYDQAGRLESVIKNGMLVSTFTYDGNGNRLSFIGSSGTINGVYDAQDRLVQYGSNTYNYTANGELLSKNSNGQITSYEYDVLGNLRSATLPDGTQLSYLVDGLNRRVGKKVNGSLVQGFLYQNSLKPIAELDGNNNVVSRFIYASRSNVPDYIVKGGVTYRIISDHLGSPRLVINTTTGQIPQKLDYDEFGNVIADTNPGFQPFGFAGGLYDRDIKLNRFGTRDYDAETGRWTAKDLIGLASGATNLYSYVNSSPEEFIDPSGLEGEKTHGLAKCTPNDSCTDLTNKMQNLNESLQERRAEMEPFSFSGQSVQNYMGHAKQIEQQCKMLSNCEKIHNDNKCDGSPPPTYNPYPLPGWKPEPYTQPTPMEVAGEVVKVVIVVVVIALSPVGL